MATTEHPDDRRSDHLDGFVISLQPEVVVAPVEVGHLLGAPLSGAADLSQAFEIPFPRSTGGEVEQHRRGLAGLVPEAVDAPDRDVDEVPGPRLDPAVPVV